MADKRCVDCGSENSLEIDHVDRHTKISHKVWTWAKARRDAELAKCVVRCRPCHQKKTNVDCDQGYIVHGDYYRGYRNGCHCSECRAANVRRKARSVPKKDVAAVSIRFPKPEIVNG